MAGGNLSPRQKMINLMYLVFIAMLALNMSKEVLSAFGSIYEKLGKANESYIAKNSKSLAGLTKKAEENEEFKKAASDANKASALGKAYYDFLEAEKALLLGDVDDPKDYEAMDKSSFLDERYYKGGKLTPEGTEFLAQMDAYRKGMLSIVEGDNRLESLKPQIEEYFDSGDVEIDDGGATKIKKNYISYHFVGFPSVSSITKLTQTQNDIKRVENELLSSLLSENLKSLSKISDANYETVMTTSKGAYYTGETFDGLLSLGRVDAATKPAKVNLKLDGRPIGNKYEFEGGRIKLKVGTGTVGDHTISGELIYMQDGKEVPVTVNKKFTTINRPNSATISADKMNVVYRGVDNPMTISFAGIQDNNVTASAPGLTKKSGSKYVMRPNSGKEVTISVTGKLPDGAAPVSDKKTFRIKGIPRPTGTIRGEDGSVKMTRSSLEKSPVGAALLDFDFDLKLKVTEFKFKVEGAASVKVSGTRLNSQAKAALKRAKRGSTVQIFDVKAQILGNSSYRLPKVSPVFIELSN